jgi:hypothetical protein
VLVLDCDALLLNDPRKYLRESTSDADLAVSSDCLETACNPLDREFNTGVFFARDTLHCLAFLAAWTEDMARSVANKDHIKMNDQSHFRDKHLNLTEYERQVRRAHGLSTHSPS